MLRKLIKYEFLADYKKYGVMGIAIVAMAILVVISEKIAPTDVKVYTSFFLVVFSMSSVFIIFAASILLIVLSTIRFYKSFLKDEGYLMHTLPVHTWQLIASKLITAYIWFLFLLIISAVYVTIIHGNITWLTDFYKDLIDAGENDNLSPLLISSYISFLLAPFSYLAHIYFSFALGNLFSKNKLAMSVVMFLVINFAERIITTILLTAYLVSIKYDYDITLPTSSYINTLLSIVLSVIYLIAAERIFAKKLNLE